MISWSLTYEKIYTMTDWLIMWPANTKHFFFTKNSKLTVLLYIFLCTYMCMCANQTLVQHYDSLLLLLSFKTVNHVTHSIHLNSIFNEKKKDYCYWSQNTKYEKTYITKVQIIFYWIINGKKNRFAWILVRSMQLWNE